MLAGTLQLCSNYVIAMFSDSGLQLFKNIYILEPLC